MRRHIGGLTTAVVCLLVVGAWRPASPQHPLTLAPESKLWFDGKSTVRDWSCKAAQLDAVVEAHDSGVVGAVLGGTKAVRAVSFSVPVEKLDCDNNTMNGHMWKALNATTAKTIAFTMTSYELTPGTPLKGTLQGDLTINGVTKPITMPMELSAGDAGALKVTGRYPLKMTEWDVKPPRLMMGTLKVNEMVDVGFELLLK